MGATSRLKVIVPWGAGADVLVADLRPLCVFFPVKTERIPQTSTRPTTIPTAGPRILLRRATGLVGFEGTALDGCSTDEKGAGSRNMLPVLFFWRGRFRLMAAVRRDSGSRTKRPGRPAALPCAPLFLPPNWPELHRTTTSRD